MLENAPQQAQGFEDDRWRQTHLGRWLGHAMRRFDERVLQLMARNPGVPLALANLAARDQISAAHIHITRHLAIGGSRLTDLAASAGMSKQAMGDLVDQCEAWGLVTRQPDPHDKRARQVVEDASLLTGGVADVTRRKDRATTDLVRELWASHTTEQP